MEQDRIRIVDVADALGLSTATVSKVIHGKTEKISDETIKRVQQELERSGYIPNMAGILLARNNSRIIGVVVNDHEKYEGRVLEDGFVMSSLNDLSREVNEKGYFLMIKTTADISEIPVFASMWNMDGLILIGFCEADYESLRNQMRISFVVYDGYFQKCSKVVNLVIDHYNGGYQAGKYLKELGHEVINFGTDGTDSCNYPEYGEKVGRAVVAGEADCGVLICGTGVGISIAANKVNGVRAAVCSDTATARLVKEHNNANIIAFGARIVGTELAKDIVKAYLDAEFQGGRHQTRIDMIHEIEKRNA